MERDRRQVLAGDRSDQVTVPPVEDRHRLAERGTEPLAAGRIARHQAHTWRSERPLGGAGGDPEGVAPAEDLGVHQLHRASPEIGAAVNALWP
jgi:hypothetical protein